MLVCGEFIFTTRNQYINCMHAHQTVAGFPLVKSECWWWYLAIGCYLVLLRLNRIMI